MAERREPHYLAPATRCLIGLMLIGGLGACESLGLARGDATRPDAYPSLGSVPATPRPNLPIEERRQIVRDLIEERDRTREQTAVVRRRSGVPALTSSAGDVIAEEVVPEPSDSGPFRLRNDQSVDADSVYRRDTLYEDGGLDDFIRQLKRNTAPPEVDETAAPETEPVAEESGEDDVSTLSPAGDHPAAFGFGEGGQVLLAAFLPVIAQHPPASEDVMIRLAADGDEPGFFCSWLGWSVAWSSMCVADAEEAPADEEGGVVADLEEEGEGSEDFGSSGRSSRSGPSTSEETDAGRAERRLSEEDAAEAIEDTSRSVLGPVSRSLEKLRDFVRSNRPGETVSPTERSAERRAAAPPREPVFVPPPQPHERPRRREDITIVDRGETFTFVRTPTPAFRPSRDDPALVILPPVSEVAPQRPREPPRPATRPAPLLADLEPAAPVAIEEPPSVDVPAVPAADQVAALEPSLASEAPVVTAAPPKPVITPPPELRAQPAPLPDRTVETEPESPPEAEAAALALEEAKTPPAAAPDVIPQQSARVPVEGSELSALTIQFGPDVPVMPRTMRPSLAAVLLDAEVSDQKIFIIGEASTNHRAKRRATDVGAALVQLGATAEILEYDHEAIPGLDQVRLVLKPAQPDFSFDEGEASIVE